MISNLILWKHPAIPATTLSNMSGHKLKRLLGYIFFKNTINLERMLMQW